MASLRRLSYFLPGADEPSAQNLFNRNKVPLGLPGITGLPPRYDDPASAVKTFRHPEIIEGSFLSRFIKITIEEMN